MKSKILVLIIFLIISFESKSQSNNNFEHDLIESVKKYCVSELKMNISKQYYSSWTKSEKPNYYLYVSKKDSLISGFNRQRNYRFFGHNYNSAIIIKKEYDQIGYSTLLYETYGTSSTRLSNHFLSYSNESIAFIAFHEATHQHIRINSKLPYSIEEATCDIVGNYGTLKLFSKYKKYSKRKAKKQIKQIESISAEINTLINNKTEDNSKLEKCIKKLNKKKNKFKIERYDYKINNAYLLRNKSYTLHYYKLKKIFFLTEDLKTFLEFVVKLPNDESECLRLIDEKIKTSIEDPVVNNR